MIQRLMTRGELKQCLDTYLLTIEPLLKIAMSIEQTQPIASYRIKYDGFERIEQDGWSKEAKDIYAAVEKEIEVIRGLHFGTRKEEEIFYGESKGKGLRKD